LSSHR